MKNWIKKKLNLVTDEEIDSLKERYDSLNLMIADLRDAFRNGGPITWEALGTYEVSTDTRVIGYPTGENCMSYRMPDVEGLRVFHTVCVAEPGMHGRFGWHFHPDANERNVQLTSTAICDGKEVGPYGYTEFEPYEEHDYILPPGASLITYFKRVPVKPNPAKDEAGT